MIPKFRAWIKSRKRFEQVQHLMWHKEELTRVITSHECVIHTNLPEDVIILQSTGLFDKNGVEIFEGDFLKNKDKPDTILICEKSDLQASFRARSTNGMISLALWHDESRDWTVIGNIHENPELVEVGND